MDGGMLFDKGVTGQGYGQTWQCLTVFGYDD